MGSEECMGLRRHGGMETPMGELGSTERRRVSGTMDVAQA